MSGLYTYRWQKESKAFLAQQPLCECPQCDAGRKRVLVATVVDHHIPHRGDLTLFWDKSNWRRLAKACHDSWKQQLEKSGTVKGCDADGVPLDPRHPWRIAAEKVQRTPSGESKNGRGRSHLDRAKSFVCNVADPIKKSS